MQDAGVDDVARWLVERAELPQYEPAFRDNKVDGPMLQDLVANAMLGELVESRLHQSRLRSQLATFERRASAAGAANAAEGGGEGAGALGGDDALGPGARASAQGTRRRAAEAALPAAGDDRPRQRPRHAGEPQAGVAPAAPAPLAAFESPTLGMLVYTRPPLADLEVRAAAPEAPDC